MENLPTDRPWVIDAKYVISRSIRECRSAQLEAKLRETYWAGWSLGSSRTRGSCFPKQAGKNFARTSIARRSQLGLPLGAIVLKGGKNLVLVSCGVRSPSGELQKLQTGYWDVALSLSGMHHSCLLQGTREALPPMAGGFPAR
jgi:hypothetical protein